MTRRTWLAATASLAAQAPLKIAYIGGSHSHGLGKAQVLLENKSWQLVGVWEPDAKVMAGYEKLGVRALALDAILKDASIPVVAVESAVIDHQKHTKMALEAGKHVHVDKPPAHTMAGMREIVALARAKNRLLQSGYMWRYHPGVNAIREAMKAGWLGEVYMVKATINTTITPDRRPEWGLFKGGQMFELGSHMVDAIVRLMGKPEKVTSHLMKSGRFDDKLMDNTVAVMEYARAMAVVQSATLQPGHGYYRALEVLGTKGTATVRPMEPPGLEMDLSEAAGPYAKGRTKVPMPKYARYVDDFVELAAAVRGERALTVDLEGEMASLETLLRASGMA